MDHVITKLSPLCHVMHLLTSLKIYPCASMLIVLPMAFPLTSSQHVSLSTLHHLKVFTFSFWIFKVSWMVFFFFLGKQFWHSWYRSTTMTLHSYPIIPIMHCAFLHQGKGSFNMTFYILLLRMLMSLFVLCNESC